MTNDSCMTCRYWLPMYRDADYPHEPRAHGGVCRRYPPAVGYAEDSGYGFHSDTPGGWPLTDGSDWCGEWGHE